MFTCLPIIPRKKGRKNCLLLLSGIKHVPFRGIQARCESPPKVWGYFSLFTHFGLLPLKPRKRHLLVGHGLLPEIWLVSLHPQPHWPSTSSFSLPWNSLIRHPLFAPCFRLLYNWVIFRWLKTLDIANKWQMKMEAWHICHDCRAVCYLVFLFNVWSVQLFMAYVMPLMFWILWFLKLPNWNFWTNQNRWFSPKVGQVFGIINLLIYNLFVLYDFGL